MKYEPIAEAVIGLAEAEHDEIDRGYADAEHAEKYNKILHYLAAHLARFLCLAGFKYQGYESGNEHSYSKGYDNVIERL